jgi:hypothetical protein
MAHRSKIAVRTSRAMLLALLLVPVHTTLAQDSSQPSVSTPAPKARPSDIPRLADGHPNLQGLWHNEIGYTGVRNTTQLSSGQGNAARGFGDSSKPAVAVGQFHSPGVPLPFPYLPIAQEVKDYRDVYDPYHDPEAHCHLPGVPRETEQPTTLFPVQIIQDDKYVTLLYEYVHDVRIIPEDGSPHPKQYWAWNGDSRGHWEGDTFVVDVTNFNGRTWLDMEANFVDENEHVIERYTMVDANTLNYSATVEDPTVFTKPWTMHLTLKRNDAKDEIVPYDCHEGERDSQHYTRSEGNVGSKHE